MHGTLTLNRAAVLMGGWKRHQRMQLQQWGNRVPRARAGRHFSRCRVHARGEAIVNRCTRCCGWVWQCDCLIYFFVLRDAGKLDFPRLRFWVAGRKSRARIYLLNGWWSFGKISNDLYGQFLYFHKVLRAKALGLSFIGDSIYFKYTFNSEVCFFRKSKNSHVY